MPVERQIMDDEPLMIAWKAYKNTEDFRNTAKWATQAEHLMGSLWAVFVAGYESRTPPISYDAAVEEVAWLYCPECGCADCDIIGWNKERVCTKCGQSWFRDIDYSDVIKKNLNSWKIAKAALAAMGISEGKC